MSVNLIKDAVSHDLPSHKKPVSDFKPDHSKGWSFSFKYYKQIDFFGLKAETSSWFSSLLDRLQDFCSKNPDDFNSNHAQKQDYRYHPIDWEAKNIPIKREDLDWVDRDIIENYVDFPFYQFQISKANGRIVGFWDVKQTVFHIVLLDPKHNIQPAGGKYNYRVDRTSILPCKYTSIITEIDRIKSKRCFCEKCTFKNELTNLQDKYNVGNFVYFQLDDDFYEEFRLKTQDISIAECVEKWIIKD